jgi:hypothetical protein
VYLAPKETLVMITELLGNHNRISLTSKGLIFEMSTANFLVFWKQYHQLKLYEIEQTVVDPDGFLLDTLMIKIMNGPFMRIVFKLVDSQSDDLTDKDKFICGIAERWVIAINERLSVA